MKIAFIIYRYFPFGGLERNFLKIAQACLAANHQVDVYCHHWQGERPLGLHIIPISVQAYSNHKRLQQFAMQAAEQWQQQAYDCIVGFQRIPGLDFYYCADVCFKHQCACKYHAWYRFTPRYKTYSNLEASVFSKKSKTEILLLSEQQQNYYQKYYHTPDQRFHLLPPGIDQPLRTRAQPKQVEPLRQRLAPANTELVLLFIGSDFRRKGLDRVIKSIQTLRTKRSIQLWVLGQDQNKSIQRQIKKHRLTEFVHFLGPQKNVQDYLLAADLLIHPAYFENTGNVLLEAMSVGLPVIATENCGYAHYIKQANAGIIIDTPFKQEELNNAIQQAMDAQQRQQWQENALSYSQNADFYSRAQQTVRILEAFVNNKA